MKKISFFLLVLLVTTALGIVLHHYMTIPKQEGIAHLKPAKMDLYSNLSGYASPFAIQKDNRPEGVLDLPEGISDGNNDVQFFSLPVGKNSVFVIIQRPGSDKATAWVDTDMDGCLSNETPLSGKAKKYSQNRHSAWEYFDFGNIQLKSKNFISAPFLLTCHEESQYIQIQPTTYKQGKIRLGNQIYRVAVVDGDFDGQFNTLYSFSGDLRYFNCDTVVVDYNTNAFLSRKIYDSGKLLPLGNYIKFTKERYGNSMPTSQNIAECYYSINLSTDGTKLQMRLAEPVAGTLKIGNNKQLSAQVFSDAVTQWVNFEEEMKLPVGLYQVHWGRLRYEDDTGHHWKLSPSFREDVRKGQFEIKEGQTFTINPGPPFKIKTDIQKEGDKLRIGAGLVGNEGEEYGLRLSRSMPEPKLKIFNEDGTEMHTGKMEYG
ncbi:MAG: hypothetical protein ACYSUG_04350 [Planctomycetota bacterium]|jgi:hypothetical protein